MLWNPWNTVSRHDQKGEGFFEPIIDSSPNKILKFSASFAGDPLGHPRIAQ